MVMYANEDADKRTFLSINPPDRYSTITLVSVPHSTLYSATKYVPAGRRISSIRYYYTSDCWNNHDTL